MTAAVVADTHLRRPGALPEELRARLAGADLIVHAGDLIAAAVLDDLESLGPPVLAVHGNVDEPPLRRRLPRRLEFDLAGATVGLIHDAGPRQGRLARLRREFPGCAAAVFGHSHIPLHERDGAFQIFNPGSPTARRRAPRHTMGLLRAAGGNLEFELVALGPGDCAAAPAGR